MSTEVEKKNQKIGMGVSIGIHGLLLILFFLVMAWREPDPPVPEYGIELNFGLDAAGTGDIQPEQPASTPQLIEEQIIEEQVVEDEVVEEPVEDLPTEEIPVQEEPEVIQEEVIEDSEAEDSPDVIEPVEEQPEPQPEPEEEIIEEKPEPVVEKPVEEEIVEEQPVVRNDDIIESPEEGQGTLEETAGAAEAVSQGDDADAVGDEGDPQGVLDPRAIMDGTFGGGGGPMLDLTGWIWDFKPDPKDTSNENGKIVFEIKIDDMGEIISVRTLERTVSPSVERIYKTEVESLTFSPISSNTTPAPVSTGKITFIIRSK
jgi:outer membrane biosynthesis protein TonB